ncbi:triose-phosphate isomerase [Actinomadura rubrisoli]|uniref:Triosephosphate isomerase n=1 Tax=Actinomadura rubrisoli TaxID=2530368 RepID=A0A4R5AYI8_9ACTN|nr:triose-phosphate isomerase [Actinomadura rubrisoli]TDD75752.1 triose-phosphate isomerase [Actinomadura rubrisoli]
MAPATPSRKPLMAGNWKMNKNHLDAILLVQKMAFALKDADHAAVDVVVVPPFTDLRSVQTLIEADRYAIQYGAQDVSPHASGAYTGEIAASMLAKLGCSYAIVGHSERRQYHAEDDALVNAKARAALAADLSPILCVGEGLEVRKAGEHVPHVLAQLDGALAKIPAEQVRRTVIAYEPVWAIGTGEVATPKDAQEVCAAIRTRLAELYDGGVADQTRILYGGSVKGSNIAGIMAEDDVDGALVGGASLDPGEFVKICRYRDLPV